MKKRKLFLLWSLFASFIMVIAIGVAISGGFSDMHRSDQTNISYVILAVFVIATAWAGYLSWMLSEVRDTYGENASRSPDAQARLKYIDDCAGHGILAEKLCPLLGLLGTVWGFMIMFGDRFEKVLGGDENLVKEGLGQLASGISTAFVTTGVGVLCGTLLMVQYYCIEYSIRKMRPVQ